jgi:hypothetical protein
MKLKERVKLVWRKTSYWNILMVLFTAVIAFSNGCYGCYARKQFRAMNKQLWEIHQSGIDTHNLAKSASDQVKEMMRQASDTHELAVQAKNQADTARRILESSTRPYVGLDTTAQDNQPQSHSLSFNFNLKNFSSTPAYNANFAWCAAPSGFPVPPSRALPGKALTIYPGQGVHFGANAAGPVYDDLMNGRRTLSVSIYGTYDGEDKRHYMYCNRFQFEKPPIAAFADLGQCDISEERAKAAINCPE